MSFSFWGVPRGDSRLTNQSTTWLVYLRGVSISPGKTPKAKTHSVELIANLTKKTLQNGHFNFSRRWQHIFYTECVSAFGVFPGEIETPLKLANQVALWLVRRESPRGKPQKLKHSRYYLVSSYFCNKLKSLYLNLRIIWPNYKNWSAFGRKSHQEKKRIRDHREKVITFNQPIIIAFNFCQNFLFSYIF